MTIAAYSSEPFLKEEGKRGRGFISSLTNNKMFPLKEKRMQGRVLVYNPHYLLFGNSELRIKACEARIESNFGSYYGFFNSLPYRNPEVLFGVDEKAATMENYEVYQLTFKQ